MLGLIGCIDCEIDQILDDITVNGRNSVYYETYAPLLADPTQNALLANSKEFIAHTQIAYFAIAGFVLAAQVCKHKF